MKSGSTAGADELMMDRVAEIAERRGVPRINVVMAWLPQNKPVVASIIGAIKMSHIEDAVAALSISLDQEEIACLEEQYVPHKIVGHV